MNVIQNMMYLGYEMKESKKSGNRYLLVKTMDTESSSIYEWYVSGDRMEVTTTVGALKPFTPVKVGMKISSFNNKAQVDLENIQAVK